MDGLAMSVSRRRRAVADVKPRQFANRPDAAQLLAWTGRL